MQVSETESYNRWCPMVRSEGDGNSISAGSERMPVYARCIGSSCMMWRWDYEYNGRFHRSETPVAEWKGYCGLAGKP